MGILHTFSPPTNGVNNTHVVNNTHASMQVGILNIFNPLQPQCSLDLVLEVPDQRKVFFF